MTTVQIVGIAVAAAVVALLVVALVVTRRRGGSHEAPDDVSFLDRSPQDTFDGLGRAEEPVEEVTLEPRDVRGLRRDGIAAEPTRPAVAPVPASEDTTGEIAAAAAAAPRPSTPAKDFPLEAPLLSWGSADDEEPPRPTIATVPAASDPSAPPGRRVPLSDIIVTTSRKVVDLDDPEVRRMLKDLVKYEIDEATRYREQGQHTDAAIQLAEAEKISRALGMNDSADAIHQMMTDLQG